MQNTIAIVCDCDDTLAPDTTVFLLNQNRIDQKQFWNSVTEMVETGWDPPLAYMRKILDLMRTGEIEQNTNKKLAELGKEIIPYDGVPDFVSELKSAIKENRAFMDAGVTLEFYIISSGIEDLIKGSMFSSHFTDIFAGRYAEDSNGLISSIKSSVTFTEKTKFLYAINKGISGQDLRRRPYLVNDSIKREERRIPFENMIYLGDGPSDIPCFSAVRGFGGNCIGIVGNESVYKGFELARGKRTTVGPYVRNYRKGSDLRLVLEAIVNSIGNKIAHSMRK